MRRSNLPPPPSPKELAIMAEGITSQNTFRLSQSASAMGPTHPRKEEVLVSADGFRGFGLSRSLGACVSVTCSGGLCAGGRCSSQGHQKEKRAVTSSSPNISFKNMALSS